MPAIAKERSSLEKHLCSFSALCFPFCFLNCFFFAFSTFFFLSCKRISLLICVFFFFSLIANGRRQTSAFFFFLVTHLRNTVDGLTASFFLLIFCFSPFRVTHKLLLSNVVTVEKKKKEHHQSEKKAHTQTHTLCRSTHAPTFSFFVSLCWLCAFRIAAHQQFDAHTATTHTHRHTHKHFLQERQQSNIVIKR